MKAKHLNELEQPEIVQVDILKPIISLPTQIIVKIDNDTIKSNLISSFNKDIKSLCGGYYNLTKKCRISSVSEKAPNTALLAPN